MNKQYNIAELIEILTHTIANYEGSILEKLESFDLTVKQFDYIYTISKMKNQNLSELAKELKLNKPSITAIIEKFSQRGYIKKVHPNEDKRSYYIHLTEKGEHVINE
jgi:DNA-binding MarR family transcriptional regulator